MSYCAAATLPQKKYASRRKGLLGPQVALPDLFFDDLDIPPMDEPDVQLHALRNRQRILSGENLNWLRPYEYAAQRLLTRVERERLWAM